MYTLTHTYTNKPTLTLAYGTFAKNMNNLSRAMKKREWNDVEKQHYI